MDKLSFKDSFKEGNPLDASLMRLDQPDISVGEVSELDINPMVAVENDGRRVAQQLSLSVVSAPDQIRPSYL